MHFRKPKFLDVVRSALAAHDLDPRFLEIELTETTVMDDAESSVEILEELSRMGVIVSVDDFGTGYSSMSYLRRFPIDKLKIDRSFIADLTKSSEAAAIVKSIISLAHSLRIKVVAEGVETAEQLQQLRVFGCDQYQGYYRSAALPPGEIEKFIQANAFVRDVPGETTSGETSSKLAVLTLAKDMGRANSRHRAVRINDAEGTRSEIRTLRLKRT
jgi:EAL domain-containing protein (putative c-di-GMP-specific phosphodiesterase class I)